VPPVPQIVQTIVSPGSQPDGVAFHATQGFAVTNDEDGDGMTKFAFPGGFEHPATVTPFSGGGFRGDLLNVGADGCIYLTHGPHGAGDPTLLAGARYDDGTVTAENSLVRVCSTNPNEGFVPGVGVRETMTPACSGTIGDLVWADANRNG